MSDGRSAPASRSHRPAAPQHSGLERAAGRSSADGRAHASARALTRSRCLNARATCDTGTGSRVMVGVSPFRGASRGRQPSPETPSRRPAAWPTSGRDWPGMRSVGGSTPCRRSRSEDGLPDTGRETVLTRVPVSSDAGPPRLLAGLRNADPIVDPTVSAHHRAPVHLLLHRRSVQSLPSRRPGLAAVGRARC